MPLFEDQTGRTVRLDKKPDRIISTVPSQTELIVDLGLEDKLVGITKFCIHPEHIFRSRTRIGGTKKLNIEKIRALQPELIICNKEENLREEIELLCEEFPVWISDIFNLQDAYEMFKAIGKMTGTEQKAEELSANIEREFKELDVDFKSRSCLYLIWKGPWMAAGSDTFIDSMINTLGLKNAIEESRYPVLQEEDIRACKADLVFLSSEPYPFKEKHIEELQRMLPHSQILLVDGELFSWYGTRLLHAPAYFSKLYASLK